MTVSDPGAGQQQGREWCVACGHSPGSHDIRGCLLCAERGAYCRMFLAGPTDYAPSPTPPARDSGRTVDGYGRRLGACTECGMASIECTGPDYCCPDCLHLEADWEGYETAPVESSGRDEAREAVARWLCDTYEPALDWDEITPGNRTGYSIEADELLDLPAVKALLRGQS